MRLDKENRRKNINDSRTQQQTIQNFTNNNPELHSILKSKVNDFLSNHPKATKNQILDILKKEKNYREKLLGF